MGVQGDGRVYRLMPEMPLNDWQRDSGQHHPTCAGVPEIVNPRTSGQLGLIDGIAVGVDRWPHTLDSRLPHPVVEAVVADRTAYAVHEEPVAAVVELVQNRPGNIDGADRPLGLGRSDLVPAPIVRPLPGAGDPDSANVTVDV